MSYPLRPASLSLGAASMLWLFAAPAAAQQTAPGDEDVVSLTPYAQIIVNLAMNTGTTKPSQEAPVAAPAGSRVGDGLPSDGSFLITGRQSRVGLAGKYEINAELDMTAKVEVDFWGLHEDGGPTGATHGALRLRLGYADLGTKSWRIFAGQTWSVVTPRLPLSLSHSAIVLHTGSGVLWQRLPQLGFQAALPFDDSQHPSKLDFKLAVVRSVSAEPGAGAITRFDNPDPGSASQLPGVETHLGFESGLLAVGFGGRYARERFLTTDSAGAGGDVTLSSWVASADLKLTTDWFWVGGQAWTGENLNSMFAQQGVKPVRGSSDPTDPAYAEIRDVESLPAIGGWVEAGVPIGEQVKAVVSVGLEQGDADQAAVGATERNLGLFGGLFYSPVKRLTTSLEYYRTDTHYATVAGALAEQKRGVNDNVSLNFKLDL